MGFASPAIPFPSKEDGDIFGTRRVTADPFCLTIPTPIDPPYHHLQKAQSPKKKTRDSKNRSRKANHQANIKQFKIRKIRRALLTIQGSNAYLHAGTNGNNKHCCHCHSCPASSLWYCHSNPGHSLHHSKSNPAGFLQTTQHPEHINCAQPKASRSDIKPMAKTLCSSATFSPSALGLVLEGGLGWNKTERERG